MMLFSLWPLDMLKINLRGDIYYAAVDCEEGIQCDFAVLKLDMTVVLDVDLTVA